METTMLYGAIKIAKWVVIGQLLVITAEKFKVSGKENEIISHKKWSDLR
jgi:hypothetical protein